MPQSSATKHKPGAQIKITDLESTALLRLAAVVQEPLDMLLAKSKHKLSVIDRRVYWWILSKMATLQTTAKDEEIPIPNENLIFSIPINDLYLQQSNEGELERGNKRKWTRGQLTNKVTYSNFKLFAKKLIERSIIEVDHMNIIDPTKRKVGAIAIFPRVFYENGILEVHVDRLIVPTMCTLSKGYTKYQREAAMALGHDYSQILYVRLCRFLDIRHWNVTVDDLRVILEASSYPRYSNFKQKVLLPAIQEINDRTDIVIDLSEVYSGKKVVELRFNINLKSAMQKHELKQLRQDIESDLIDIYSLDINIRRQKALELIAEQYTFSSSQQKLILNDETRLNRFIELHIKIRDNVLKVKKSPTSYISSILFPTVTKVPAPELF